MFRTGEDLVKLFQHNPAELNGARVLELILVPGSQADQNNIPRPNFKKTPLAIATLGQFKPFASHKTDVNHVSR